MEVKPQSPENMKNNSILCIEWFLCAGPCNTWFTQVIQAYFILLLFCIALCRYCGFFYKLKVCSNSELSKSIGNIFPKHLLTLSLSHILVILITFQNFHYYYIYYDDLWSVTSDVTIVIVLGQCKPCPYKIVNLINVSCVLTAPMTSYSTASLLLLRSPYSLRHNYIKIRPMNNSTMASKCSSEKSYVSHFKSKAIID